MDFLRPIEAVIPGAQGRILGVLCNTTAELNLRTIAQLAGVSQAQASRVLPNLVELGMVERREVPPSSLFSLVPEHVACRGLLDIARPCDALFEEIGRLARNLSCPPVSIVVFGSVARGEARATSDIDLLIVRPEEVDEDDGVWSAGIEELRAALDRLTGNRTSLLELDTREVAAHLAGRRPLWGEIRRDGRVAHGLRLDELARARRA